MIAVESNRRLVATRTLTATFEDGVLVSLVRRRDGAVLVRQDRQDFCALQMPFPHGETVALGDESRDRMKEI
jgi:hypothetical protein